MMPSTTITRFDLASPFTEFDLAMDRKGFIGARVLRPRLVGIQAADVGKVPIEALLETQPDTRAPGGGYKRGDFEFAKFSYATEEHGREEAMDERKIKIYSDILDAEAIHAQRAMDIVLRNYEIDVADAVYNTTTWTGASLTTAITHEWDDATNAVPINDIHAAIEKVFDGCGLEPNALIINRKQRRNLTRCAQILDRIKYSGFDDPKKIPDSALAELFDLQYIIVAGRGGAAAKNTADKGLDVSLSRIWSDEYAMVGRIAETDDPQEPCIGRTFMWDEDNAGMMATGEELAIIVEEYREENVRGSVIRARNDRDIVVMYSQCGHLLSNVTTI